MSASDVENYKQIKADLDQLRLTVEKSELWVEKSGGYGSEDMEGRQGKEPTLEVLCWHLPTQSTNTKALIYFNQSGFNMTWFSSTSSLHFIV